MALVGKLETDVEVKISAQLYHEIFSFRPHHVNSMSPDKIQACELHEGEWGKNGKIISWHFTHEGKSKVDKEIVENIDYENLSITYKIIEGELLEKYKNFKIIVKATPKLGGGSMVHWTLEYEKLHKGIPDPHLFLDFLVNISKDVCSHHSEN